MRLLRNSGMGMTIETAIDKLIVRHESLCQKGASRYNNETEEIINSLLAYYHEHESQPAEPEKQTFPFLPRAISYFDNPIANLKPYSTVTLSTIYKYICNGALRPQVAALRNIIDKKEARKYKAKNFPYVTFAGWFSQRDSKYLIELTGYTCIDFDHVPDVPELLVRLLKDEYFITLLAFRSPSGDGLKWVIPIDLEKADYATWFKAISIYIEKTYSVKPDQSGSDIARACFLTYDPEAYINPCLL